MIIIGFGHRKRVGKDTACQFLVSYLRMNTKGLAIVKGNLAYDLKLECYNIYGWAGLQPPEYYDTPEGALEREIILPKLGKSPRQIWIEVGNKLRDVYEDTWIDLLINKTNADILILGDIRYPNEVNAVRRNNGHLYKIERDSAPVSHDVADIALRDYNGWDQVIGNHGPIHELHTKIVYIGNSIINKLNGATNG